MNFYYAKVNSDGTYSEPMKLEAVKDISVTTAPEPETNKNTIKNTITEKEMYSGTVSLDFGSYTKWKEFIWRVVLNLKRCEKRLISKNIWKEGGEE